MAWREILLLGIEAEAPDPELGYIVPREAHRDGVLDIAQFVEKPSATRARALIDGGALWNAFIIAATAQALLTLIERRFPGIVTEMRRVLRGALNEPQAAIDMVALYDRLPVLDFSRDVLEAGRHENLRVLAVPACGWSDLGTLERVAETLREMPDRLHRTATWFGEPAQISLPKQHAHRVLRL